MRSAALRPLLVLGTVALAALGAAAPAGAHGGATIAKGGSGGVSILTQAEVNSETGTPELDMSTTIEGPGTGDGATVTYWIRPSGGKTFKATTKRDDAGIASANIPLTGRGEWRDWDVSAIVDLSTGTRLRVSNAEANPPGPDPAATAGGGATGADDSEGGAGTTTTTPSSGGVTPGATTDAAPATTTDGGTSTSSGATAAPIEDVSGDSDGTPGWVVPSAIVVLALAVGLVLLVQRRRRAADVHGDDEV